jgi:hypothetical protein
MTFFASALAAMLLSINSLAYDGFVVVPGGGLDLDPAGVNYDPHSPF